MYSCTSSTVKPAKILSTAFVVRADGSDSDFYFIPIRVDGRIDTAQVPSFIMDNLKNKGESFVNDQVVVEENSPLIGKSTYVLTDSLLLLVEIIRGVVWSKDTLDFLSVGTSFESICTFPVDTNYDGIKDTEVTFEKESPDFNILKNNIKCGIKNTNIRINKWLRNGEVSFTSFVNEFG